MRMSDDIVDEIGGVVPRHFFQLLRHSCASDLSKKVKRTAIVATVSESALGGAFGRRLSWAVESARGLLDGSSLRDD